MPDSDDPDAFRAPLLTAEEVAARLQIGRSNAYALMRRLPFVVRIGGGRRQLLRVPAAALEAWIAGGGDHHARGAGARSPAPRPAGQASAIGNRDLPRFSAGAYWKPVHPRTAGRKNRPDPADGAPTA